jgi:hypothetical protein
MPIGVPTVVPPAIYQKAPAKPVMEEVLSPSEVNRRCHELTARYDPSLGWGKTLTGCSMTWPDKCVVIRVNSERVRIHEWAHCNGWPKDHPGGIWSNTKQPVAKEPLAP